MKDEQVSIACDNTVVQADGSLRIVESMFSTVCDLARDHGEVLSRLHPVKKERFDQVLTGAATVASLPDRRVDIELHVNNLRGGVEVIDYADLVRHHAAPVIGEAHGRGFEPGAEPVIRQVRDKSFRLLFHAMPPRHHRLGAAFDAEHFCEHLVASCAADMHRDDRDVFYIAQTAQATHIKEIFAFLRDYQGVLPVA
ncbi:hypothetical protein [Massilia sp. DWR3-1-1]|uniref:hypothetical protein n=1 Tax=Massilia sp. DWR3-1-1 TaxID=2804559 RepID=UPI003CF07B5C